MTPSNPTANPAPSQSATSPAALNRGNVLVTGASSGIGQATVTRLAQKGWLVFAGVRKQEDADSILTSRITNIRPVLLDVSVRDSIQSAAVLIQGGLETGGLDGLVNNAGIGMISPVENMRLEDLRRIFEVNLFGQIDVIQTFLPLIRKAGGRIVNIGSVGDHLTPPFGGALAASKAAFASMTAALRLELRRQRIHVCLIEPGSINTPAVEKTLGAVEKTISTWSAEATGLYAEPFRRMAQAFAKEERGGSSPDAVAEAIERALTARHPAIRYPAGKNSRKLALLARLLPERLLDSAILRTFGL